MTHLTLILALALLPLPTLAKVFDPVPACAFIADQSVGYAKRAKSGESWQSISEMADKADKDVAAKTKAAGKPPLSAQTLKRIAVAKRVQMNSFYAYSGYPLESIRQLTYLNCMIEFD